MSITFNLFPIKNSLGFVIHLMNRELSLGLQKRFSENGLEITPQHWNVLSRLWETDGLHQSDLAKKSHKDRHNITRIVNLLEKNGFIYRTPDSRDKRLLLVYLTEKGKSAQSKLTEIVTDFLKDAFKGFSSEEIELMQKTHLKVLSNLGYRL